MRNHDMSEWEKFLAVLLVVLGLGAGCFFLDDLQNGLATVRLALDPRDPNPAGRGEYFVFAQGHSGGERLSCALGCIVLGRIARTT